MVVGQVGLHLDAVHEAVGDVQEPVLEHLDPVLVIHGHGDLVVHVPIVDESAEHGHLDLVVGELLLVQPVPHHAADAPNLPAHLQAYGCPLSLQVEGSCV